MPAKRSKAKPSSLASGRPPLLSATISGTYGSVTSSSGNPASHSTVATVNARRKSSKATRKLINTHHQLQKSRAAAEAAGDTKLVSHIDAQIDTLGGLHAYQAASLTGQDKDRGGDSSVKLVEWLTEYNLIGRSRPKDNGFETTRPLRVLEIGALSSKNAISSKVGPSGGVECVRRLDLHSQEPGEIEEIDFMDLPVPTEVEERFDVISLSLVLNYVPDPTGRGEMLKRTVQFFRPGPNSTSARTEQKSTASKELQDLPLPCLFVVLPLPCLSNSRYMDSTRFEKIMIAIGYEMVKVHRSQKLQYMLFRYLGEGEEQGRYATHGPIKEFKKVEINPGRTRNNFCIVLKHEDIGR